MLSNSPNYVTDLKFFFFSQPREPISNIITMKNSVKSSASKGMRKTVVKSKAKSKISKKSQRVKDQEALKDLDSMVSASSIFAELQANKPEAKKIAQEKKTQERKAAIKSVNQDLLAQLDTISSFSL